MVLGGGNAAFGLYTFSGDRRLMRLIVSGAILVGFVVALFALGAYRFGIVRGLLVPIGAGLLALLLVWAVNAFLEEIC